MPTADTIYHNSLSCKDRYLKTYKFPKNTKVNYLKCTIFLFLSFLLIFKVIFNDPFSYLYHLKWGCTVAQRENRINQVTGSSWVIIYASAFDLAIHVNISVLWIRCLKVHKAVAKLWAALSFSIASRKYWKSYV